MSKNDKEQKNNAGKEKHSTPKQKIIAFTGVLLFAAFCMFLYYQNIEANRKHLSQHHLRHLGTISTVIEERLEAFKASMDNQQYVYTGNTAELESAIRKSFRFKISFRDPGADTEFVPSTTNTLIERPGKLYYNLHHPGLQDTLRMQVRYADLLDIQDISEGAFDVLFIIDSTGQTVLFNSAPERLRLTRIDSVLYGDIAVPFRRISTQSNTARMLIAGKEYECYLQIMGSRRTFALIESDRFSDMARAVHGSYFADAILVLIILLLSVPLITLHFADFSERIRPVNVMINIGCIIIGTAFAALLLADFIYSKRNMDEVDIHMLRVLSRQVQDHVSDEFTQIDEMLTSLDSTINSSPARHQRPLLFDTLDARYWKTLKRYPYFEQLYWLDADGTMIAHWTAGEQVFDNVPLADREYYREIIAGERNWIFPHYTRATGEFMVAYSRPSTAVFRGRPGEDTVASVGAMDFLPRSLVNTWFPEGYASLVVNMDGDVLFHSNTRRALHENLFVETPDAPLRDLMHSGMSGDFRTRYWEDEVRMYAAPLRIPNNNQRWYLIIASDQNMLSDMKSGTVAMSAMLFIFFLLPLLAGFAAYATMWDRQLTLLFFHETQGGWYLIRMLSITTVASICLVSSLCFDALHVLLLGLLVPHIYYQITFWRLDRIVRRRQGDPLYRKRTMWRHAVPFALHASLFLLTLFVVVDNISLPAVSWSTLLVTLGLVFFVIGIDVLFDSIWNLTSRKKKTQSPDMPRSSARQCYVLFLMSIVVLVGIVPVMLFSRVAYDAHGIAYERLQRQVLRPQLREREKRIWSQYKDTTIITSADSSGRAWTESIAHDAMLDTCDVHVFDRNASAGRFVRDSGLGPVMTARLLRPMMLPVSSSTPLFIQCLSATLYDNAVTGSTAPRMARKLMNSRIVPPRELSKFPGYAAILPLFLGIPLVLFCLYLIIRYGTNRIFFADLALIPAGARQSGDENQLFLWARREDYDAFRADYTSRFPDASVVCTSEKDIASLMPGEDGVRTPERHVVLDCFEHRYHDATFNLQKLALLEQLLVCEGTRVSVICSVDPMYYFAISGTEEEKATLLKRWESVLRMFVRVDTCRRETDPLSELSCMYPYTSLDLTQLADCECRAPGMEIHRETVIQHIREGRLTDAEEVLHWIGLRAKTIYQNIWITCSKKQRFMLYRMAQDGFVPYRARPVVQQLCERGLLRRTPAIHICNESFRRFLLDVQLPSQIQEWQEEEPTGLWTKVKHPLLFGFAAFAAVLFWANPAFYNSTVAIISSIAAVVPLLLRVRGYFLGDSAD